MKRGSAPDRPFRRHRRVIAATLPPALGGSVEDLHRARIASRRLREALTILDGDLPRGMAKKLRRRLRRVTRALGPVRELDVADGLLAEMAQSADPEHARPIAAVRRWVHRERAARQRKMRRRVKPAKLDKLGQVLTSLGHALPSVATDGLWRSHLAARIGRLARLTRVAVDRTGGLYSPERVHQVRIRLKKLRYALEFAADTGPVRLGALVRQLKAVQDMLGQLHDLEVVLRQVWAIQEDAHPIDASRPHLDGFARQLEDECRHLHGRYVVKRPTLVRLCAKAEALAQRVAPERPNRTGARPATLKMSLRGSLGRRARASAR